MSTNASVHVKCADGNVRSIYVHSDGYVEAPGVGDKLRRCYNTQELAEELVLMGDCSSLADSLDDSTFYHRDRNEDWSDVQPYASFNLKEALEYNSQQYDYYFDTSRWHLVKGGEFLPLEEDTAVEEA